MAKNSNGGNFGLTVNYKGIETIEGVLVSISSAGATFRAKKSGSSTKLNQFYPAKQIVALVGKEGGEAELSFINPNIPLFRSGKKGKEKPLPVQGIEELGPHLYKTRSDDFSVVVVNGNFAKFSGEEKDEDAPKRGAKPKGEKTVKKAKTDKPKGKAAKGDDWE